MFGAAKEKKMILTDVISKGFDSFGNGHFESVSILDREGETIMVIPMDDIKNIDEKYLNAKFLSIGSSTLRPDRIRIRIDVSR